MAEYGLNLWDYWRIVHKRKWIILSVFLVSLVSSHFFAEKAEPVYKATVTLNIDTDQPVAEITGTGVTFWGSGPGKMATQLELIKGYNVMKEVAIRLEMIDAETPTERVNMIVAGLRSRISVNKQQGTSLVDITAVDNDPDKAKGIAEAVTDVFIQKNWEDKIQEARRTKDFVEKQLKKLEERNAEIRRKLESVGVGPSAGITSRMPEDRLDLRTRLAHLRIQLADLKERFTDNYPGVMNLKEQIENIQQEISSSREGEDATQEDLEFPGDEQVSMIDAEMLENELEINKRLYGILRERYERASLVEASKSRGIEVVNPAVVPRTPDTAPEAANMFLGGIIGLVLGLVAALITESMDTSIGTIEDVEDYLKMPVLGVIPRIDVDKKDLRDDFWKNPPPPEERKKMFEIMGRLVTQYKPKSPIAEAYRNLQTYLRFSGIDKFGNTLMFTSAGIQEGKTITTVNSALSMAQLGYKVLLIDGDLRRPSVHKVFGIEREMGLTEVVLGTFKLEDVVKTIDDIMMGNIRSSKILQTYGMENLSILTTGHLPSNPTEILSSQNMREFIKEAKEKFQVVMVDSAPILPVTDSCLLASKIDCTVLVYEVGRVSRGALRRSKMQIENAKGRPIGIVLNGMRASDMRFGSPFYYYYQKYYGETPEK
jgi:tyrosine-protein kinase Etk/Wzc